ncbi:MAG TPA: hypothetical protein DHV89_06425, partial [Ruminococcus sp.]|nr:hypothetical protein [Ruminococcus sp.]
MVYCILRRCAKGIVIIFVVIPLTHHKNSGYTELKVLGVYLSPAAGGKKIYNAQLSFGLLHF